MSQGRAGGRQQDDHGQQHTDGDRGEHARLVVHVDRDPAPIGQPAEQQLVGQRTLHLVGDDGLCVDHFGRAREHLKQVDLVVTTAQTGRAVNVIGAAIFAATMMLLYCASTVYHAVPHQRAKALFSWLMSRPGARSVNVVEVLGPVEVRDFNGNEVGK